MYIHTGVYLIAGKRPKSPAFPVILSAVLGCIYNIYAHIMYKGQMAVCFHGFSAC